ncbi:hypothetical protein Btru_065479 [Bulinus truncatus]|nr:hypothetical protein Btru_065479 [Bulinus truncatus]
MYATAMFFFLAMFVYITSAQNNYFQLDGFTREDFRTQVSTEYFNCSVILPCDGKNMTSVTYMEILRSKEIESKSLASMKRMQAMCRLKLTASSEDSTAWNISAAISSCNMVGGYLAEINDRNEYLVIQSEFIKAGIEIMLIGGTDEAVEGKWLYQYSRSPVTFFDWNTQEPNNFNNEDCLELRKSLTSKMNDIPCFNSVYGDSNFLCEINTINTSN